MTSFTIVSQNISRSLLGGVRRGGNVAPLRIQVQACKPNLVVLSEVAEDVQFTGKNVFSGYKMTQYSRNVDRIRSGGVAVFVKNGTSLIENTVRNSRLGQYTVAAYEQKGTKIILAAVYGPSSPDAQESYDAYDELIQNIKEISQLVGSKLVICCGDFNLNFDKNRPIKPLTVRLFKQFIVEFELLDAGSGNKIPTWRRPHLPNSASRIDYNFYNKYFTLNNFTVRWTRFDHAMLTTELTYHHKQQRRSTLRDWSLASPLFQEHAPEIITNILIEHDVALRSKSVLEKTQFINGRSVSDFELDLQLVEPQEGITCSHILMIIIDRLQQLQRKVQNRLKFQRKNRLDNLSKQLSDLYLHVDRIGAQHDNYPEICEQIIEIKSQIKADSDHIEMASRMRISHFYQSSSGQNVAASFYVCKDRKGGGIKKLIQDWREIVDPCSIIEKLTDAYVSKVGIPFNPSMTLNDFLDKYDVELPRIDSNEYDFMGTEFTKEELKEVLQSSKKLSAPGPSGQGISLFKYIYKMIPHTFLRALNELSFVPGLIHNPKFSWMLHRNIVYIPKPGKVPNNLSSIRPLSLLETVYKLQTKILTNRMNEALQEVLYKNQHGFQKNKSIQSASLPVLEAIRDAELYGKSLQFISVDIQSAFDSIDPNIIFQVMRKENFSGIYVDAMANLTHRGTGRVSLEGEGG
jgi:hypothetical protein